MSSDFPTGKDSRASSSEGERASGGKRDRFRRLAEARTNRALEAILLIGNLSNRQVYDFDESDIRKIVKAMRDAVTSVESRFSTPQTRASGRFKL